MVWLFRVWLSKNLIVDDVVVLGDLLNNTLRGLSLVYTQECRDAAHDWNKPLDQYLPIRVRYISH